MGKTTVHEHVGNDLPILKIRMLREPKGKIFISKITDELRAEEEQDIDDQ